MSITPLFSGEMQLLKAAWTNTNGPTITLALASFEDLEVFRDVTTKKKGMAGQRLAVVMVEIGDQEQALPPPEKPPSVRAALLCKTHGFWEYVEQMQGYAYTDPVDREQQATHYLRAECLVASRAELDTNGAAAARFMTLLTNFTRGC